MPGSLRKIFQITLEFSLKDFANQIKSFIFIAQSTKRVGVLR
jgi:hypothetical protein